MERRSLIARGGTAIKSASELVISKEYDKAKQLVLSARLDFKSTFPDGFNGEIGRVDKLLEMDLAIIEQHIELEKKSEDYAIIP